MDENIIYSINNNSTFDSKTDRGNILSDLNLFAPTVIVVKDLLAQCNIGCTHRDVVNQIISSAQCSVEQAEDYTDFLIDSQLLVNKHRLTMSNAS